MTMTDRSCSVEALAAALPPGQESLIPLLQDIQDAIGYIPESAVAETSRLLGVSETEIYGVATFFRRFRFTPPAEHTIHVCLGTACHVEGGARVLNEFENQLGIQAGQTTPDGAFALQRVACMGCCALAPVAVVDETLSAGMTPKKVRSLVRQYKKRAAAPGGHGAGVESAAEESGE